MLYYGNLAWSMMALTRLHSSLPQLMWTCARAGGGGAPSMAAPTVPEDSKEPLQVAAECVITGCVSPSYGVTAKVNDSCYQIM